MGRIKAGLLLILVFSLLVSNFTFHSQKTFAQNISDNYQVVVVGGEPEGVAAAISAARNGFSTLLVCPDRILGGTMTLANLNSLDMNYGPNKELLTRGIFAEFFQNIGGDSFDVSQARKIFANMVAKEKNLTVILQNKVEKPIFADDRKTLIGLQLAAEGRKQVVYGQRFIDATADADLAAISGVPYTIGKEDLGLGKRTMAATLVFQVGGANWQRISQYLNSDQDGYLTGANQWSAWGYGKEMRNYQADDPQMKMRGLNIGRQADGSVLINALLIFDVDPLNAASLAAAQERAKTEVVKVVEYLQQKVVGFEDAYLMGTAEKLYVRESRHIKGEYQLTLDDVLDNRIFPDRIALGSYPVDVQASSRYESGVSYGVPKGYSIPFRSLVPLKIENLLVVGRSASYTSLAAGSARVIPVGMVEGQSAGFAAVYSIRQGMTFRELSKNPLDIKLMQDRLQAQGVYLPNLRLIDTSADRRSWTYPYMQIFRNKGFVAGNYDNKYNLDEPIKPLYFTNMLKMILNTLPSDLKSSQPVDEIVVTTQKPLQYSEAIHILNNTYQNYLAFLDQENKDEISISPEIEKKIKEEMQLTKQTILTKGQAMALLSEFLAKIEKGKGLNNE